MEASTSQQQPHGYDEAFVERLRTGSISSRDEWSTLYKVTASIVEDWAPALNVRLLISVNEWFRTRALNENRWFGRAFISKLRKCDADIGLLTDTKDKHIIPAGFFCFVGQLIIYFCQYGWWESSSTDAPVRGSDVIDLAWSFSLLYMKVDYFLDSDLPLIAKKPVIEKMKRLVIDPEACEVPSPMRSLVATYKSIIEKRPQSKDALVKLFTVELETSQAERSSDLTRSQYLEMAERKGGFTTLAISSMFGNSEDDGVYEVGCILQLLDDMMDVHKDMKSGINTIATYDLKRRGTLDILAAFTAYRISKLSRRYTIFRILLMQILTHVISKEHRFSRLLQRRTVHSTYLNWSYGAHIMEMVNSWLRELADL